MPPDNRPQQQLFITTAADFTQQVRLAQVPNGWDLLIDFSQIGRITAAGAVSLILGIRDVATRSENGNPNVRLVLPDDAARTAVLFAAGCLESLDLGVSVTGPTATTFDSGTPAFVIAGDGGATWADISLQRIWGSRETPELRSQEIVAPIQALLTNVGGLEGRSLFLGATTLLDGRIEMALAGMFETTAGNVDSVGQIILGCLAGGWDHHPSPFVRSISNLRRRGIDFFVYGNALGIDGRAGSLRQDTNVPVGLGLMVSATVPT